MEKILLEEELDLECFERKGTPAQQIIAAMAYEKINLNVIDIEHRINDARKLPKQYRGMVIAKIARTIRQERIITVCAWHKPKMVWWDGAEWNNSDIPPGVQSHGMCPECYEKEMKQVKILLEQGKIIKELENDLRSQ
jgi:hypothetical protein